MDMKHNVKHMANILTIFMRVMDYVYLDRGKIAGHFYILFLKFNMICNILPISAKKNLLTTALQCLIMPYWLSKA